MGDKNTALNFLVEFINKKPQGSASDWYVGIASDVESRLFGDHNVNRPNGLWARYPTDSSTIAREVEKALLAQGLDGGSGGGREKLNVREMLLDDCLRLLKVGWCDGGTALFAYLNDVLVFFR